MAQLTTLLAAWLTGALIDQSVYDRRGNRVAIVQHTQYAGGSNVADTLRAFAYDGHGQIISRRDATDKNGVFDQGTSPATQNQHYMYVAGNQVGHTDEAGKLDILTQVTAFSSGPTNGYVVQVGDTLKSIAQAVYGNASLWYVIAQANAIDSDDGLAVGMDLTIPEVKTSQNDSTTFKPYNASEIAGSTTPTLPTIAPPPPPPSRAHCNVVATIIVIAVVVAASFFVGPLAGEALGSTLGGVAVGAAAGSAAGQLAGDALGTHQGFSFGEVFTAAATAVVTAGVANYLQTGSADPALSAGTSAGSSAAQATGWAAFGENAAQSGAGYVAQNAAGKLVGQKEHFSWAGLVSSSLAGGVAGTVGPTQAQLQQSPANTTALRVGAAALVEGGVQRGVGQVLGDRNGPSLESIGTLAVGSALGASVGIPYAQSADLDRRMEAATRVSKDSLAYVDSPAPQLTQLSSQVNFDENGTIVGHQQSVTLADITVTANEGRSIFDLRSITISADAAVRTLSVMGDTSERSGALSVAGSGSLALPARAHRSQLPQIGADLGVRAGMLGSNDLDSSFVINGPGVNATPIGYAARNQVSFGNQTALNSLIQQRLDTLPGSARDQDLASRIYALGSLDQFNSFRPEVAQAGRDVARVTAEQRYAETGNVRVGATPDDTQQLVAEEMLRASTSGVFAMVGAGLAMRHNPNDVANLRQVVDQSVALGDMTGAYVGIRDSRATAQAQRGVVGSRASRPTGGSDVTFDAGGAFARAPWAPGMVAGVTPAQRTVGEPLRLVDPVSNVGTRMMARGIVPSNIGNTSGGAGGKVPVQMYDVMKYGESKAGAVVGDELTGDHIPSYAAIRQNVETTLGRELTADEAMALRDNTNTVIVAQDLHASGRTYFGANTQAQVAKDSLDLTGAAMADQAVHLENAAGLGYSPARLQVSFGQLNQANQQLFNQLSTEQSIVKFFAKHGVY